MMSDRLRGLLIAWAVSVGAVVLALLASLAIVAAAGSSPGEAAQALYDGALGSTGRMGAMLAKSVPLTLAALGWVLAFSARRINVGLEGQILAGGVVAATIGLLISGIPAVVHLPLMILGGILGGCLWAGVAAWLWAKRDVNEIISTLLLNFVMIQCVSWLVSGPLEEPTQTLGQTAPIEQAARWPTLIPGTVLHLDFFLVPVAAVGLSLLLRNTTAGFRLRATGANPDFAAYSGIKTVRISALALVASGGLAGLAGASLIGASPQANMADNFSANYGFEGIVVALLARNSPLACIPAAFLFASLKQGGGLLEARVGVPSGLVLVTQGLVIILVAGAGYLFEKRRVRRVSAKTSPGSQPVAALTSETN
ncbi:ABC transporter permease [Streptosporangium sp. NBC_01755]|uniref:ABC transporter permease n=1 Tax=unclassified Streptosporangium TaxID=2632669 RepID=UPI002DDA6036|nr:MULTISPECIES: ABC transporter permease [unclassified Streptosporangium]WSA26597.1 ABC transporter permease [Streptosporangium sp. NBC_01810]WSD01979.1 ABC transporter permease [Streptosporangium sp. NBC_01755]